MYSNFTILQVFRGGATHLPSLLSSSERKKYRLRTYSL